MSNEKTPVRLASIGLGWWGSTRPRPTVPERSIRSGASPTGTMSRLRRSIPSRTR